MKSFLLLAILVTGVSAFAYPDKMHAGYGSSCNEEMSKKFLELYPKADPDEYCYTICLRVDGDESEGVACFPVFQDSAGEAKDLINAIVLPLREEAQVAQVSAMAKSAKTFFEFSKMLFQLAPIACNSAYDNIKSAEQALTALGTINKTDKRYKGAEFLLQREKQFLKNTQSFHSCEQQEI